MSKTKLYKIDSNHEYVEANNKNTFLEFTVGIVVYACVLLIATNVFRNFYIESFGYAILAALILSCLNSCLKPLLVVLTLPLTIVTLGIMYPLANIIILKLCGFLLGSHFVIEGFLSAFFISIFISILRSIFDSLITKRVGRGE